MRIPLWQLARFCDRALALPAMTAPCRRGGRETFRESSLMVLVLVGAAGEAGKAGVLPRPAQGGRRGSGFQFWCSGSGLRGACRPAGWEPAGLPVVRRPDTSRAYRGGLLPAWGRLARIGLSWRSSLASWRRLTEVK